MRLVELIMDGDDFDSVGVTLDTGKQAGQS